MLELEQMGALDMARAALLLDEGEVQRQLVEARRMIESGLLAPLPPGGRSHAEPLPAPAQQEDRAGNMSRAFVFPPFSVLNAREGTWQERKRAWLALGIKSEIGRTSVPGVAFRDAADWQARAAKPAFGSQDKLGAFMQPVGAMPVSGSAADTMGGSGISVFDPVLCELVYRWFCPPGGHVLDPFAGGSVRGVVAHKLGRTYEGVELRPEQVAANEEQARTICGAGGAAPRDFSGPLTPVERCGDIWLKRDDAFTVAGQYGGKARTCWQLAQGASGLVTAGSRRRR